MVLPLNALTLSTSPVTNITPFTYRDGQTYLQRLENLARYINKAVVPYVNEAYKELAESVARDIEKIINNSVIIQREVLSATLDDDDSEFREKLSILFASNEALEFLHTILDSGRLSPDKLAETIDKVAGDSAYDESTRIGQVITQKTLGAAPRSLTMSGSSRLGRAPILRVHDDFLFSVDDSPNMANLYWPQIIDLRSIATPDRNGDEYDWAMIYSTDHQNDAKVAIRLLREGVSPFDSEAWRNADENVVLDIATGGSNVETPRLMYSETLSTWLLYVSTSSAYEGSVQHTRIFRSNDIHASIREWADTGKRIALTVTEAERFPGDGHTGYFNPFRIGGGWYSYSIFGGQDAGMHAFWRSRDGLNWHRDPLPILWDAHLTTPEMSPIMRLSIGVGPLFVKDGFVYGIGSSNTPASGAIKSESKRYIGRLTDDFRSFVEQPSQLNYETKSWMGTSSFALLSVFEYGGRLYAPISADNSRKIGLGEMVF